MSPRLVFADLDDTLFATARKQAEPSVCKPATRDASGRTSGLASPAQCALWDWLAQWGDVVPVTARRGDQLARVELAFAPHAVWNQGASVRLSGVRDEKWHARTLALLDPLQDAFAFLDARLRAAGWPMPDPLRAQGDLDGRVMRLVVRERGADVAARAGALRALLSETTPSSAFWVHVQRDNLVVLPRGITKQAAVRHLIEVLKPELTVGAGDSLSDVPFLRLCDFCVFPRSAMALDAFGSDEEDAA